MTWTQHTFKWKGNVRYDTATLSNRWTIAKSIIPRN
jgi:hypothetical protein